MTDRKAPPTQRTPMHLWLVGGLGLLFNSVGVFDFLMTQTRNASYMSRLNAEQIAVLLALPPWLVVCWALAVWGGAVGALLLLVRNRLAVPVLMASLIAMTATALHNLLSPNGLYETAGTNVGFMLVIFTLALGLWLYARGMGRRGALA